MSRPCLILHDESVFAGSIVGLKIGGAVCPIYVHLRLLCARSPYFKCLLADWSGVMEETVTLPDEDPETFDQFLSWLYTDCFTISRKSDDWLSLCKLWLLAEKYQVPSLQNRVVEAFSCCLYQRDLVSPDLKVLAYVYGETESQSLLRKLFIYICVRYGNDDGFAEVTRELPPDFHTDYALQQAKKTIKQVKSELNADEWNLTDFMVQECEVPIAERSAEPQGKAQDKTPPKRRRDSVTEERKRRRS